MGRTQFIALTSPCGGGIDMQRAGGAACSRSGGGHVVGRRVPSVPAGCPVRRLSSSDPSSLAVLSPVVTPPLWLSSLQ